jgi:hypothetical protein
VLFVFWIKEQGLSLENHDTLASAYSLVDATYLNKNPDVPDGRVGLGWVGCYVWL